jgi:hypothetical protein
MAVRPVIFVGAGAETAAGHADVELEARVSADALVARARPETRTELTGAPALADRVSTRRNLPRPLRPGRVEHAIAARRRVAARLAGDRRARR